PASTLTPAGASRNGIDKIREGIVSRGVLLDVARARGVERLQPGQVIGSVELEAAERAQGVRVESGDVLLIRTGHIRAFTVDHARGASMKQMPGLGAAR